ncbi:hypothetical protein [Candidatus Bathycorpusculum sp.]|uniref:hypothetical protein n=1 Tax=Candidatus Bathycorpusculum sp. TaxID=2994959 RepID=UPI00281FEA3A|nr:hypothetical protein [Candidatus Termitimicrobium sp.]MCL2685558.1 hypothetical protein [Candidatus Termitimicrobium sp.]
MADGGDIPDDQKSKCIPNGTKGLLKVCSRDGALVRVDDELLWKGVQDGADFQVRFSNPTRATIK